MASVLQAGRERAAEEALYGAAYASWRDEVRAGLDASTPESVLTFSLHYGYTVEEALQARTTAARP